MSMSKVIFGYESRKSRDFASQFHEYAATVCKVEGVGGLAYPFVI
jgi:hypothetical protein